MYDVAETVSINANYLCVYNSYFDENGMPPAHLRPGHAVNFFSNFHDCQMSTGAVKTVKKCVNTILFLAHRYHNKATYRKVSCTGYRDKKASKKHNPKYLCTFVTLTLQGKQQHTDDELARFLLNPFIVYAKKYFHVKYYIWKKELQKNGNVHFHFVCDKYIDHVSLRNTWNRLCNRGKVPGCATPFNYVDQYTAAMKARFSNGFDYQAMQKYCATMPATKDQLRLTFRTQAATLKRDLTPLEKKIITQRIVQDAVNRYKRYYDAEMKKPAAQQFTNPNSTDISAVKNARQVSAYVGKYIAKDVADNNRPLARYIALTDHLKNKIFHLMKLADWKKGEAIDYSKEEAQIKILIGKLENFRAKHCKIKGRLWFKSQTLTPFLKGASDFMSAELNEDLRKLVDYLRDKEKKTGRKLILQDADRQTITMLVQASDLKILKLWHLYRLYDQYIVEGILQNINTAVRRSELRRQRDNNKAA